MQSLIALLSCYRPNATPPMPITATLPISTARKLLPMLVSNFAKKNWMIVPKSAKPAKNDVENVVENSKKTARARGFLAYNLLDYYMLGDTL
ncbi:hypothetical protein [Capybara microvirus Cap1_SP_137]|nr:hypothetical protein [Capybara microvirus Cap1_SP_137]